MPQSLTQKAATTFIKGLITEAGELTFPPDASVDESNCSLERDGSRTRRLALEYEAGFSLNNTTLTPAQVTRTLSWENVGGVAGRDFVVVQVGALIFFYGKPSGTLSGNLIPISTSNGAGYYLDLAGNDANGVALTRAGSLGAAIVPIQVTSVSGALVVVSSEIKPFTIERDETTEAFTVTTIDYQVRDFEWQGEKTLYTAETASASVLIGQEYDTANTGWVGTKGAAALATYLAANTNNYPALTHPWYSGKTAAGVFAEADWQEIYAGSTLIVNGHFILDLFSKDRDTASGLSGVTTSTEASRFKTVATYAGRVFYSGLSGVKNSSKVYFSQLIEDSNLNYIGDCYQVNDPTSEETSDLLDTDGGYLNIPEAHNIKKLHVTGSTLLVFAENGVWAVSGVDDIFRATGFSVSKLTSVGVENAESFVSAEGRPYWWSASGIHTLVPNEVSGLLSEQNISLSTIQTFWNAISSTGKSTAVGEYDAINKQVFWLYSSLNETVPYKFNEILVMDEVLGAFYPWTIADEAADTNYVCGTSFYRGAGAALVDYTVVHEDGSEVQDGAGNTVVVTQTASSFVSDSSIKFLVWDGTNDQVTFAGFTGTGFLDWGTANYTSYAEAGYDFLGDMTLKKNAPYLTIYLRRTETGWTGDETNGYNPIRPSSCKVSAYWDFKDTASSTAQQAYRFKSLPVVDPNDLTTFDYPTTVITSRLKVRGRGRSVRLRFDSEQGKDFNLLGWEMIGARNPGV